MGLWGMVKKATGIQAYQDNKEEKRIREKMNSLIHYEEELNDEAQKATEKK